MARLLEHQGKKLFLKEGIAVPQGKVVASVEEALETAQGLGYPVAVKAQIRAGGRGKAGGIIIASQGQELTEAVNRLLGAELLGARVSQLLLETAMEIKRELYMGVTADSRLRQVVLVVSETGGVDIERIALEHPDTILKAPIDSLRSLYQHDALNLVRRLGGLSSQDKLDVARILMRLFRLYRLYDCRLAEINPLALAEQGWIALDARVDIDDDAISRQMGLGLDVAEEAGARAATSLEIAAGAIDAHDHRGSVHFVEIDPHGGYALNQDNIRIGFDCVGAGTSLTVMDELIPLGYYPVNFCDSSGNPVASKLTRITKIIFSQPGIEGYVFVSCVSSQQLDNTARGLIKALKELYPQTGGKPNIPCLFVFRGAWDDMAIRLFEDHGLTDSPWVKVMGRDTTELQAVEAFDVLHKQWRQHGRGRS